VSLPLTQRQRVVLATLADMGTMQNTADALGVAHSTIKDSVEAACKRLGVYTSLQAAVIVARYEALNGCQWSRASRAAWTSAEAA
jgi:DNA-binding NarL/FixJ family response regulator